MDVSRFNGVPPAAGASPEVALVVAFVQDHLPELRGAAGVAGAIVFKKLVEDAYSGVRDQLRKLLEKGRQPYAGDPRGLKPLALQIDDGARFVFEGTLSDQEFCACLDRAVEFLESLPDSAVERRAGPPELQNWYYWDAAAQSWVSWNPEWGDEEKVKARYRDG